LGPLTPEPLVPPIHSPNPQVNRMNTISSPILFDSKLLHDPKLMPPSDRKAAMVMDINGCIAECNLAATDLLGRQPESLVGQNVSDVLPGLPFSQETPGYNLAYVGMNHALDAWKKQIARTPSGGSIDVEIVIYIIKRGCKCLIALFLRRPTFTALHA
ncbi:MAG: PAS domain-containing protein, partial [Rhodoferax sp.]